MAGTNGRRETTLGELLDSEPYRFDARQAVRLLEQRRPDRVPVGVGSDPGREAVRLRGSLTSSFPPSDVESLTTMTAEPGERPTLTAAFMSIGGAFGPLPPPLTTRVVERERVGDHAARDFLDVFNHRLLSLLMRHWRLFHPALQYMQSADAPAGTPPVLQVTPAVDALLALLGLATLPRDGSSGSVEKRFAGVITSLLGAAGLLNQRPVSAHALERLLGAHLGRPVHVKQLRGGWLTLADDQRLRMGRFGTLGRDAVLGGRVWDQAAGILIEIGPMDRRTLESLLPGGGLHVQVAELIAFALGNAFDVELHLLLRTEEVQAGSLGAHGARLGWTAWLGHRRQTPGTVRLGPRHTASRFSANGRGEQLEPCSCVLPKTADA
jgi:type VI secretion system protein ImpH